MPSYVKNVVTVQHKDPKEILRAMDGEDGAFDFNNLVPMPDELKGIQCVHDGADDVFYRLEDLEDAQDNDLAFGGLPGAFPLPKVPTKEWLQDNKLDAFTVKRLIKDYGAVYWYEWCIHNWGTKWPASEVKHSVIGDRIVFSFFTAWDPPFPVIRKFFEFAKGKSANVRWQYEYEGGFPDDQIHTIEKLEEI